MRLLLDEHFSPAIARHLRDRGFDVVAVVERPDLTGATDGALLETMGGEGRVIVTENVGDFVPLAARVLADGGGHAGILLTSSSRFPRTTDGIGAIMRALAAVMASDPAQDAGRDEVRWLL